MMTVDCIGTFQFTCCMPIQVYTQGQGFFLKGVQSRSRSQWL